MRLVVHQVERDDVFHDLVRVHHSHRKGVRAGRVCRVSANGKNIIAIARNSVSNSTKGIWLDNSQRSDLDVKAGKEADFNIESLPWYYEYLWVWQASDPVNRTAGRLGVVSLGLGIMGLLLGAWSLYLTWMNPT